MRGIFTRPFWFVFAFLFIAGNAGAQQSDRAPKLNPGDIAVTGFSGMAPLNASRPRASNKSAADRTFINPDGASLRIFDVSHPGSAWDARLLAASSKYEVLAKDVGQVFGVALDDATPPNIYVAATSAFGLNIVSRGRDGAPERRKTGGPSAGWMRGQFGLDLQGGPGAIYKIDGRTGIASLLVNVTLGGVSNPGPGLGNLAYDAEHKQLFASDLYSGMIRRFDLNGKELGIYDHGLAGLGAAKLPTVSFNEKNRPNIASDRFDSEKPETWGFAPAARRVWAVVVHDDRLYYSVLAGPQIWSVGIARDGSFLEDPRWELDVPAQGGALPVTDIAFLNSGAMIVAQRAPIAAAYDYSEFTRPAEPPVLRFSLKNPNDAASPGRWKPQPVEYAIGFAGSFRNTNGGVALGYGYGANGVLNTAACEASLWTSGQNLRNNPALRKDLESGGPLVVNGLQANPVDAVRRANEPPSVSYFIDYDGKFDDPKASGHLGSVRIYTTPCAAEAHAPPVMPPPVIPVVVPGGCVGPGCQNSCVRTCVCPEGSELKDGECIKLRCPSGEVWENGKCVRVRTLTQGECRPPMIPGPTPGSCVCPRDSILVNGRCVSPRECRPPFVPGSLPGSCICPQGSIEQGRTCVPNSCPSGMVPGPCACPAGMERDGDRCVTKRTDNGELILTKKVVFEGPILLPSQPYPVTVTCGSTTTLNLLPDVPQSINNIPYGTTCSYSEPPPPVPAGVCPLRFHGEWTTVFSPPSPVSINAPSTSVTVTNTLVCKLGENSVRRVCPAGTVLRGKECVKQIACRPPMVPGAEGKCVCRSGTVLRHGKCETVTACRAPAVSNGRGGCDCPDGTVKRGKACVKNDRRRPALDNDDVRRGIGIIRGIGGGGGGERSGGGGGGGGPKR
jgi:hypothetical protein